MPNNSSLLIKVQSLIIGVNKASANKQQVKYNQRVNYKQLVKYKSLVRYLNVIELVIQLIRLHEKIQIFKENLYFKQLVK